MKRAMQNSNPCDSKMCSHSKPPIQNSDLGSDENDCRNEEELIKVEEGMLKAMMGL